MRLFWASLLVSFPVLAADVAIAPQSLTFAWQWRSQLLPAAQVIFLTSPESFTFTVSRPAGDGWLVLPSQTNTLTAQGPALVPIYINPGAITPEIYDSSITIRLSQGSVSIPVRLQVSAMPVLATNRGFLDFYPTSPFLSISAFLSNDRTATVIPSTQTPWLGAPGGGRNILVTAAPVNPGLALSAGTLQLTAIGALPPANNPLNLPAFYLGAGLASRAPLTATPPAVALNASGSQHVTVTGGPFTAAIDAPWASVSVSGETLTVAANAAGLERGTHQATVVLNSDGVLQMLPVTLSLGVPIRGTRRPGRVWR